MTENKEGDNNSKPEKKSPYDWEAFEFKICDEDMNRYILNGSSLMKSVLSYIDEHGDGNLTENEFSRYKNNPHVSCLLSKLIVVHRSAWAYSGDMLTNMIKEVEQFYDELIEQSNPQNSEKSQEIQKQRDEDLKRFEQKVKNLTFIDQLNLEGNSSLPAYCFYYFHPKAFVEQMKRMEFKTTSKYLTVEKATKSDTAKKHNVKNSIDIEEHYENLMYLGCNIYDVLYEHFGSSLCVNSCYRNEKVNNLVGGSSTSQHCKGQAIDLSVNGKYRNREIIQYIFDNKLDYDQIIWEYGDNVNPAWVHVSLKKENNRKKLTRAVKSGGGTHYKDLDVNVVKLKK